MVVLPLLLQRDALETHLASVLPAGLRLQNLEKFGLVILPSHLLSRMAALETLMASVLLAGLHLQQL